MMVLISGRVSAGSNCAFMTDLVLYIFMPYAIGRFYLFHAHVFFRYLFCLHNTVELEILANKNT